MSPYVFNFSFSGEERDAPRSDADINPLVCCAKSGRDHHPSLHSPNTQIIIKKKLGKYPGLLNTFSHLPPLSISIHSVLASSLPCYRVVELILLVCSLQFLYLCRFRNIRLAKCCEISQNISLAQFLPKEMVQGPHSEQVVVLCHLRAGPLVMVGGEWR